MKKKSIKDLVIESELTDSDLGPWMTDYGYSEKQIRKLIALVAEECAAIANVYKDWDSNPAAHIAETIRAKFQTHKAIAGQVA